MISSTVPEVRCSGLLHPGANPGYASAQTTTISSFPSPAQHLELIYIFKHLFIMGLYAASLPQKDPAKFTVSSLFDSTISMIHPIVAAGSNRCEAFKSLFGITYEQMQEKNKTNFYEVLNIDLITKTGNIKYNLTATRRINRLMARAQTTVILIHGFMESSDGWMVQGIAPELLKKPELKVFALDGRKIINLEYFRSSTYIRFMGEMLGTFLSELIKNGQDPSKIYIVGHSLGSHIAGVAGKRVRELTGQLLGRITALDPAGPCFSNVSASGRLDKTDAEYVDVIHSNAGMLGIKEPVDTNSFYPMLLSIYIQLKLLKTALTSTGHCSREVLALFTLVMSRHLKEILRTSLYPLFHSFVRRLGHKDFYPNGGTSQPGCYISICDHSRAWELFAESIGSPKHFPARKCENWTMFGEGLCAKNEISFMGLESGVGSPGLYFLSTKNSAPFGMGSAGSG